MTPVSYILCIIGALAVPIWLMRLIDRLEGRGKK